MLAADTIDFAGTKPNINVVVKGNKMHLYLSALFVFCYQD
jgi:hypothetical protein